MSPEPAAAEARDDGVPGEEDGLTPGWPTWCRAAGAGLHDLLLEALAAR